MTTEETTMEAVCYQAPNQLEIIRTEIPKIDDDQVLVKVSCCGICGTDHHLAVGEFIGKLPLIPGHEIVGTISEVGKSVTEKGELKEGQRVVADNTILCDSCFYCRRGQYLFCENFDSLGVTRAGGFAEYVAVQAKKIYPIYDLSDEEATLIEPASCAIHGLDKLTGVQSYKPGGEVLIFGSGPTGLIMAQLLKLNGASRVVIVANKGPKTSLARSLDCGDEYIELDRANPEQRAAEIKQLKENNPYGFDVVIEATGNQEIAQDALNYVRRGGILLVYGVYSNADRVHWSPGRIFGDEITIIGSFAQVHCFPRAVQYLDSGKIRVKGMVTHTFPIKDYQKALDMMNSKQAVKIAVKPS